MKVAVFSTKSYDKEYLDKANENGKHELVYFESSLKPKTARLAENYDAVCVFVNDSITKEVIEQLSLLKIKAIVLRCAGFNNVDIESACNNNIKVLRVPAYSPNAVAEHAVALILTLNRKTHKAYNRVREGNFSIERLTGFELSGKTAGVIGTGKIGTVFASIMKGFGCNVIAFDAFQNKTLIDAGITYLPLEEVIKTADIISLHCPLTPETNHLINKNTLSLMKMGAMLINTSRGKLIDTDAAIESLKEGRLGYLGIDVYEQEEKLFFKDLSEIVILDDKISRLMTFPNVLVTAHQAYFTDNALSQIAQTTIQNLTDLENNSINSQNQVCINVIKQ
ncbi:MAG: hydroxyacid dehydrogenase [Bacteroidetes bacterium HGW-Bacteroidetes-17]|jgi:D-lactate dehydrogenase|nr:MAG: hydroxyacid dehydrogenase [Bacteroidetes bacterium HGW-Bacteroidetes-17]